MRLSDLKFVGKKPLPDLTRTQSLRNRVKAFLERTQAAEPPIDFENPNDGDRHIELDIFVPKSRGDNSLHLPLENLSDDESSDSSSTSSDSDIESVKEKTSGPIIEEIRTSDDLSLDDTECSVSNEDVEIVCTDSCLMPYSCGDCNNPTEACENQTPSLFVLGNNQENHCNPHFSALVNALISREFVESEFPKSKQPLIEEISSRVDLPPDMNDFPPSKRLKTENAD
nr:expressed protein [Hymenolepis microstoma]